VKRAACLLLLLVSACGFQLRGSVALPFDTLYVPNATSGIALDIKRQIQAGSATRVVEDPKAAQARLQFTEETRDKEILSLTTAGRVREYRLRYRVSFKVDDSKGGTYVPLNTVALQRDLTYDDSVALAKEGEEELLFRDMQSDMVQQILRRLGAARPPAAN
jgi:LPS-assembly lipoprotein